MINLMLIIKIYSLKCTFVNLEKMLNLITLKRVPSYLRNSKRVSASLRMWTRRILFFGAILFGILTKLSNNCSFNEQPAAEILGQTFAKKLLSEKENLRLDECHESFFDKCHMVNELIEEKGLFSRVYERRDKFRFLIKKDVSGKNKMLRDLSSCIIRKFNGFEITSIKLIKEEK